MEVDGISVAAAEAIQNGSVASGYIASGTGHLILVTVGGTEIDAGLVIPPLDGATADGMNLTDVNIDNGTMDGVAITGGTMQSTSLSYVSITAGKGHTNLDQKGTDTTRASTAVLAADPTLVQAVEGAGMYEVEILLQTMFGNATNGGVVAQLVGPSGAKFSGIIERFVSGTSQEYPIRHTGSSAPISLLDLASGTDLTNGHSVWVKGILYPNTDGLVSINWAQKTSHVNGVNLKASSYMLLRRVG